MADTLPLRLAGGWMLLLGPLVALAPRGMPVWVVLMTLTALAGLGRGGLGRGGPADRLLGPPRRPGAMASSVIALLTLAALSIAWSPSGRAGPTVVEMGYVALGALVIGSWLNGLPVADARRLCRLFVVGLAAGLALFLAEWAFGFPIFQWWNGERPSDAVAFSNVPKRSAALFALLVWPAALMASRAGRRHAALLIPAGYVLLSLLLSSRSAMAGGVLALVGFAAAARSPVLLRRLLAGVLALAFAAALPLAFTADRLFGLSASEWLFMSARHRVEIWGMAAGRALEAPLLGQGIDASRALPANGEVSHLFGRPLTGTLLPLHPHNAFLQFWLELGALGAALGLTVALLLLGRTARLHRHEQPFALALFTAALAMASTAYGIWQAWWMCGMLTAGLLLALAVRAAQEQGRNTAQSVSRDVE